ncbi:SAM-dependent methyltransferase [Streptomyces sp. NPDC058280]|uniref:SAM-dependent methyltransferase n=1 Tax=Streptomyces sp. NPDC058280 TaxID=3346419 RepID=UPI0036DFBEF6
MTYASSDTPQLSISVDDFLWWPSSARVHDFMLRGKDHYACDEGLGRTIVRHAPFLAASIRRDRNFVVSTVRELARAGLRQVIDLGCGLPRKPFLHEVVAQHQPDARVLYVDQDPIVIAHADARLTGAAPLIVERLQADIIRPQTILSSPVLRTSIDLSEPVVLVVGSVLHHVPQPGARALLWAFSRVVAPGSIVILTHWTGDFSPKAMGKAAGALTDAGLPVYLRTEREIAGLFDGWDVMPPGVAPPETFPGPRAGSSSYAVIGCKP